MNNKSAWVGTFEASERDEVLQRRAIKYVEETASMSRKDSALASREFSDWCKERDISHKEMINAKLYAFRRDLDGGR